jgi:hypothetical protein
VRNKKKTFVTQIQFSSEKKTHYLPEVVVGRAIKLPSAASKRDTHFFRVISFADF